MLRSPVTTIFLYVLRDFSTLSREFKKGSMFLKDGERYIARIAVSGFNLIRSEFASLISGSSDVYE